MTFMGGTPPELLCFRMGLATGSSRSPPKSAETLTEASRHFNGRIGEFQAQLRALAATALGPGVAGFESGARIDAPGPGGWGALTLSRVFLGQAPRSGRRACRSI